MDKCIIFYPPRDNGTETFRLKDSDIESISQLSLYKDIIVKQINGSKRVDCCLHCVLYNRERNRNINYGIFSGEEVVFTKKQKLIKFDSAIDYYEHFIKDHNFELKSMEYLSIYQRPI